MGNLLGNHEAKVGIRNNLTWFLVTRGKKREFPHNPIENIFRLIFMDTFPHNFPPLKMIYKIIVEIDINLDYYIV